jgi:hypothetical protein
MSGQTARVKRLARIVSWIGPPIGMSIAYTVLALTSDTDNTGKAWMAIGFGFVLVLWLVFRIAVEGAGLSRALALGDSDKLLAIADKQLARRPGDPRYLVYKALAHEMRGERAEAAAAIADAKPENDPLALLAASVRVSLAADSGDLAGARKLVDEQLEPLAAKVDRRLQITSHHHAHLARARLYAAEGRKDEARAELRKVSDDIRAGAALRDRAKALAIQV